jgi:hypothetical protein
MEPQVEFPMALFNQGVTAGDILSLSKKKEAEATRKVDQ